MPTFRVKDLTISVGQQAQLVNTPQYCTIGTTTIWSPLCCTNHTCLPLTNCRPFSFTPPTGCWPRTQFPPTCGVISPYVDVFDRLSPIAQQMDDVQALDVLHNQLEATMKAVEEHGVQIRQAMLPQNLEQAEMLEEQLNAALKEVRNMKKDMK